MWKKCSEILAKLTALTSKNVKYDWKDEHQKFWCYQMCDRTWSIVGIKKIICVKYILDRMFTRLRNAWRKVNARKSYFNAHKFDYLGYHVTRDGVMPIPKKVEAIQALKVPKTRKQLRQFIGMINF